MAQAATMLHDWKAKRSGAAMRLTGTLANGDKVKMTVAAIEVRAGGPVAIDANATVYRLASAAS